MALPQRKLARDYEKEQAQLKSLLEAKDGEINSVKEDLKLADELYLKLHEESLRKEQLLLVELNHLKSLWFVKLYLKYFKKG